MLVSALAWIAACRTELGDFAEALGAGREAASLADEADHPWSRAAAYYAVGMVHLRQGDVDTALPVLETGLRLCEEYEIWNWSTGLASALGYAHVLTGRPDLGHGLLEQAVDRAAAMQSVFRRSLRVAWLAEAEWGRSERERARGLARQALALAEAHGEDGHRVHVLRLLGQVEAETDAALAERYFATAADAARELGMRPVEAQCYLGLGLLCRSGSAAATGREALARAAGMFQSLAMFSWAVRARATLQDRTA